ncbi:hypothetical protein [Candidatus Binatus sp.]|uniref:hypothetical protein n=1 Tax=Candidatus Binatus sp. TaxID=2811406 RepID=UPI003CBC4CE1
MLTPAEISPKIQRCLPKSELAPWQAEVYRLVSWWDVEKFAARKFYSIARLMERISASHARRSKADRQAIAEEEERTALANDLSLIESSCRSIGLHHSADFIDEFRPNLLNFYNQIKSSEIDSKFEEISSSIAREMNRTLFMYLPRERARYYLEPLKDWESVTDRFTDTIHDIEEAAKCFACDRFDGAVVHMMLVAEFGALEVGKLLELNDPKLGWPRVSKELKRITSADFPKLSPIEQKHFPLLEQISPLMLAMQNAWRHKVSHAGNRLVLLKGEFQPFVAEEIIFATRAFMRRLATDLPTI